MIGLDTNVVVRLLVNDDDAQHARALEALRHVDSQDPAYITHIVLVETWWVLTRSYKTGPEVALSAVRALVANEEVALERPEFVQQALQTVEQGADFADATQRRSGCDESLTFDQQAAKTVRCHETCHEPEPLTRTLTTVPDFVGLHL